AFDKAQIAATCIVRACMSNRCSVYIDADDIRCRLAQQRTAVTFAARDIKNATSGNEPSREKIPVPVFMGDFAFGARHETLAGEWERNGHCWTSRANLPRGG